MKSVKLFPKGSFKRMKKILMLTVLSLMLTGTNAYAQEVGKQPTQEKPSSFNLTEIVVAALVLSFSHSVLQGFRGKKD
jgi:hypothetical protein